MNKNKGLYTCHIIFLYALQALQTSLHLLLNADHSRALQREETYQQQYETAIDSLRERNAAVAEISFYAASGHGRWPAPTSEDCNVREQLLAEIPPVVTAEIKSAALADFSRDMETCACCGRRDSGSFSTHHLP